MTVYFYTNLSSSSLSNAQGTTNGAGVAGVTLDGGWVPGTATVRARVFDTNGGEYSDVALVPVVAPDGETTRVSGTQAPTSKFTQRLTPSDITFRGLRVAERTGGSNDKCHFTGSTHPPYANLTGSPPGGWLVGYNNSWGEDNLNWDYGSASAGIEYYRAYNQQVGRPSCGTLITQYMDVVRPASVGSNLYYTANSGPLVLEIHATAVMNERDSVQDLVPYP